MISKPIIVRGGEYKCRIFKTHLKLRDQQLKTIMYKYRLLYQNPMVTTNQTFIIDIHTKKKKESNTILKIVIKSQENKRRRGK